MKDNDLEKRILDLLDGQDLPITEIARELNVPVGPIYSVLVALEGEGAARRTRDDDGSTVWTLRAKDTQTDAPDFVNHMKALDKLRPNEIENPEKLSDEEIEALIFAAIDAEYRTYGAIKRHAGLPIRFDIEDTIQRMLLDSKLREESAGTVTAYFRHETKPLRCWLTGDGRVSAEFDESFAVRDEKAKASEFVASNTFNAAAAANEDWVGSANPTKKRSGEITEADVRNAAEATGRAADVAKAFKMPLSSFYAFLKTHPEHAAAFDEGREKWRQNNGVSEKTKGPKKVVEEAEPDAATADAKPTRKTKKKGYPPIAVDRNELRRAAAASSSIREVAAKIGVSTNTLRRRFAENADLREIYEANVQPASFGPKPKEAKAVKEDPKDSPVRERELEYTVEEVEPERAISAVELSRPTARPVAAPVRSNIAMELSESELDGSVSIGDRDARFGGISIRLEADLFSMSRKDRDFLNDIIDLIQRHGNGTTS